MPVESTAPRGAVSPICPACQRGESSGGTELYGLLGWPVAHSRSPAMQNAAFQALGRNAVYVPLPTRPEHLPQALAGLRVLGVRGLNVTVPHKEAVLPLLDELAPRAQAIGAVNTILRVGDRLRGENTDAPGFIADLRALGCEPAGRRVLILGAGGAARALGYALGEVGAAALAITNRDLSRAARLAAALAESFPNTVAAAVAFPPSAAAPYDLIVNATSAGLASSPAMPWDPSCPFQPEQWVYDTIYAPPRTALLEKAARDGARTANGLGMLLRQGALAFELWTGAAAPIEVMARALGLQPWTL